MKAPLGGVICPTCRARRRQHATDNQIECANCGEVYDVPVRPDRPPSPSPINPDRPTSGETIVSKEAMAAAFNEWLRRYTEDPKAFEAELDTVGTFLQETGDGTLPSYGQSCTALMTKIAIDLDLA